MHKAETHLQRIDRHIREADCRITRQEILIAKLDRRGQTAALLYARDLLTARLAGCDASWGHPHAVAAEEPTMAWRTLFTHRSGGGPTKLQGSFRPLRPDLDKFLFAEVGDETDGMPLSVISALTRLGLDPREEAGRLSSLCHREAVEQLARLLVELPGNSRPLGEAREIARSLVLLLPKHNSSPTPPPQVQIRPCYRRPAPMLPKLSQFWVACFVFAAAALVSALLHGWFPFVIGSP